MRSALLLLLLGASGCAMVTAESSFQSGGLARASFEMNCPAAQLQTVVLVRNDGLGCAGSQMGVVGCGRRATYVCDRGQHWLLNSPIVSSGGEQSVRAP